MHRCYNIVILCGLLGSVAGLPAGAAEPVDYLRDVKSVLRERCFACHGALKQESGLRLDTAESIRKGGDGGAVVVPGRPAESELLARVSAADEFIRMPPEGHPLKPEQIAALTAWIEAGATGPVNETPEPDPREHWAFRVPLKTEPPKVSGRWMQNPIDRFIEAARGQRDLQPVGPVEKSLLLRRVSLDLVGLPPARADLKAFLADDDPQAYERAVDRLLESPQYGERWARHWMDVWRYSDWFGLGKQLRYSQKHIWHWRDWIVESLNEDKGYDRMVLEMLAADELAPTDPDTLRATGFLARNYFLFNRTTWLDNTIEHTSKAFLGLTLNCTKCHDHKYDPLSQLDYYRMRAFFEPHQVRLDAVPGEIDLERAGLPRVFDAHPEAPTYLHVRGNAKEPDTSREIEPAVPAVLQFGELGIEPVPLPLEAHRPGLRDFVLRDQLAVAQREIDSAADRVASLEKQLAAAKDRPADPEPGPLFLRDEFDAANSNEWQAGPGEWSFADGRLVQQATGATRRYYRTRREPPRDFTATLKFRTLGGEKWKSVGLAFDTVDGREKLVYLSAVDGGSKLQISYNTGGGAQYPPNARQDRPVALDDWYTLEVAVRGKLVNVAIDGKHALAYELPVAREAGRIDLIAFDAVVEYESVEIRALPETAPLIAAGKTEQPQTPAEIEAEFHVAQLALEAARLKPEVLESSFVADRAKLSHNEQQTRASLRSSPGHADTGGSIAAAALAARRHELALAELGAAKAERQLLAADKKEKPKQEKELDSAKKKLEAARKALDEPGEEYPSLRASLKALEGPDETDESRRSPYPDHSTGRRTALARWIVDPQNPLTARVAVNHVWMRHFGQPLVDPVTDFGRRTDAPPLQDLLDWLAVEFVENGWSMKHLHRLIVTSQSYRLSTSTLGADPATREADPENEYYWRRIPQRMESQVVRDSLLHLSGRLDLTLGGPTIDPDGKSTRRSLYFAHSRDDRNPFLSMFDDADILRCYRRQQSVVPQQALTLANSRDALEAARAIGDRLAAEAAGDGEKLVTAGFETVLSRRPDAAERAACRETLDRWREALTDAPDTEARAAAAFVHALLNHNDFVTIR